MRRGRLCLLIASASLISPARGAETRAAIRVPASCRMVAVAKPTPDSRIGFELWLPDNWTGRYVQLGNGGFAGNIDLPRSLQKSAEAMRRR